MEIAGYEIGKKGRPLLIAGPCVLEKLEIALEAGKQMAEAAAANGFHYIFKASFDKANRTSLNSYRGPGLAKGLEMLANIKEELQVPITSDIHLPEQAEPASQVVDLIQIPAFLCRQTDILVAAAKTGCPVNIKKGQFMAPGDMKYAVEKVKGGGQDKVMLTERGSFFGYHNLVVDFRSLALMREIGVPVIFDATHSVQLPGGADGCSSGERRFVPLLARAAVAAGVDGIFMEVHPEPHKALCDGANSLSLQEARALLKVLARLIKALHGDD